MIISIEGNIGAGKSTLLKRLIKCISDAGLCFHLVDEPVDEWMKPLPGRADQKSIFELYYTDQQKFGFLFQMVALQSRLQKLIEARRAYPDHIIITERCHITDQQIFTKMLCDSGRMTDVEKFVYDSWFKLAQSLYLLENQQDPSIGIIYVRTSPSICMQRIQKRSRNGESQIDENYIHTLHKYHEEWLLPPKLAGTMTSGPNQVLVYDGDVDEIQLPMGSGGVAADRDLTLIALFTKKWLQGPVESKGVPSHA